jgi:hypothetical protein
VIDIFLFNKLKIELHKEKSRILALLRGVDFIGFRNFYYFKLLGKMSIRNMFAKIKKYKNGEGNKKKMPESFQAWKLAQAWLIVTG